MNSPLQCALRLNNEGVSLMTANEDQQAVQILTKSLNLIMQALSDPLLETLDEADIDHAVIVHNATYQYQLIPDSVDNDITKSFVYSNAVTFAPENESPILKSNINCYGSVIVLNIALVYHRQGILGNPTCFSKAMKMYETITNLVGSNRYNQGTALLVKLAAVNNLSQILRDCGAYESSQEGFQFLALVIGLVGEHQQPAGSSLIDGEDVRGMILNILISSQSLPAAAAA
jgi:hypothetical protein